MASSIVEIDYTDAAELSRSILYGFRLTNMGGSTNNYFSNGRYEEMNGKTFLVTGGDYSISIPFPPSTEGDIYIYLQDNGNGTANAYHTTTAPTYSVTKRGFYAVNDKCIYKMTRTATVFSKKIRMDYLPAESISDISTAYDVDVPSIKTDVIFEQTSGVDTLVGSNAVSIRGLTEPADIGNAMLAAGFTYNVWYACSGFIEALLFAPLDDYYAVSEIMQGSGGLHITGFSAKRNLFDKIRESTTGTYSGSVLTIFRRTT